MIGFLATLSIAAAVAAVAGLIIKFGGPRKKAFLIPGERELLKHEIQDLRRMSCELGAHAANLEKKVGIR